jgi:hypothetical protein
MRIAGASSTPDREPACSNLLDHEETRGASSTCRTRWLLRSAM